MSTDTDDTSWRATMPPTDKDRKQRAIHAREAAERVLRIEADAILRISERVDDEFSNAIEELLHAAGRVIVCGMGKSGIIAHKISATLMSTGTPSFYMHPGEAYHGDLGMVTPEDVFIAISNSGETGELVRLLPYLRDNGNLLIAMTGNRNSTIAQAARFHLDVRVPQEACPLQLAPTASTTGALAMGDALAVALMEARGFTAADFARYHPGGSLGRRLLARVEDEMSATAPPIVEATASFLTIASRIADAGLGVAVSKSGAEWAIITDGDLRRALDRFGKEVFALTAESIMSRDPLSVQTGTRIEDAMLKMERAGVASLLVFDGDEMVGVLKK